MSSRHGRRPGSCCPRRSKVPDTVTRDVPPSHLRTFPLLPLRDLVVFPHTVVPLLVGRDRSVRAVEEAVRGDREIVLCAQKVAQTNEPSPDDIFDVGTIGLLTQLMRLQDGTLKVLIEGRRRCRVLRYNWGGDFHSAVVAPFVETGLSPSLEMEALSRSLKTSFDVYAKLNKRVPAEAPAAIIAIDDPVRLGDAIVAHLTVRRLEDKQALLSQSDVKRRLEKLYELVQGEIDVLQVEKRIRHRVKKQMEKSHRDYYLNEQMQAIQKELGENDEFKAEIADLEEKAKQKKLSKEAAQKVKKEIKKLKMMAAMSAEATVLRNYLDWVLSLPWGEYKEEKLDIAAAEQVLDEDHYGLKKVKARIVEYLAVRHLAEGPRGPILCFVGPPGVGKTSLAKSIARATGRDFVRISLGGVRDEAEIRGHRRTYIGALPGKIVQAMKRAGTSNPVFLMDEVDKMTQDYRGDPASALLEVLDPEQNHAFCDHYVDLDYDLSRVLFVTTANTLHGIPAPLQDRMEIIRLPGYTDVEKRHIARRFLISKQRQENGLKDVPVAFSTRAINTIIHRYTRESGVRNLEREVAKVCRKIAKRVVRAGGKEAVTGEGFRVTSGSVPRYLGVPKFRYGVKETRDQVGVATGLAWTDTGGELLNVEVTLMPGKGKLTVTGKLGDVMKESAEAAMSYVRSRAVRFGLDPDFYQKLDVHIHLPEGAIPKDGPSAGITMATALVSALTGVPVRRDLAMTGEITLRGMVLPIGGLKEKSLAAARGDIRTVLIPIENEKDLKEIPKSVAKTMTFRPVEHMDEVLRLALSPDDPDVFFDRLDGKTMKSLPEPSRVTSQSVGAN
ncbi:MAG: endopeptidase La [Deltaproteobacteria bacterium]|nr:endopeptidase La [Deltaproteobacteria bacterium]